MFERVLKIAILTFMNPTPVTVNTSPKSIDLMENTSPLYNNHTAMKLQRIKMFEKGFRKQFILSKFWG